MSPPDTNIETQEKRHKGPLSGMALAVVLATALFVGLMIWMTANGNDPGDSDDGAITAPESNATGVVEPAE